MNVIQNGDHKTGTSGEVLAAAMVSKLESKNELSKVSDRTAEVDSGAAFKLSVNRGYLCTARKLTKTYISLELYACGKSYKCGIISISALNTKE